MRLGLRGSVLTAFLKPFALLAVLTLLALSLAQGQIAHAATITVNTTADELNADGDCSLREAIRLGGRESRHGRPALRQGGAI